MNPPEQLRPGLVLTLPIARGKVEDWRRFCQELSGSRLPSYEASRRQLGVTYERLALVESSFGASAVMTLEASNLTGALAEMMASKRPFESWYRERLQKLYGIALTTYEQYSQAAPIEPQELLFEWRWPAPSSGLGPADGSGAPTAGSD